MINSKNYSFHKIFSHIYVEDRVANTALVKRIISQLPESKIITIKNYKDIFNRKKQYFPIQSKSKKLILAQKQPPFLYPIPALCQNNKAKNSFYITPVLNCIFDCSYCFLKGIYDSANVVVFVNTEDFFIDVERNLSTINSKECLNLHLSFESDLLALEPLLGLCQDWAVFVSNTPNLSVEVRTKSGNYFPIQNIPISQRYLFAWSLSPHFISKKYEQGAPSLNARLSAVSNAVQNGRTVRICLDPIILTEKGSTIYQELIDELFDVVQVSALQDISIGPFRVSNEHYRKIRKLNLDCDLFNDNKLDICNELVEDVASFLRNKGIKKEKIILWQSQ